ncbi:MAG: Ig-like domain-containing protein, partial [Ilumatobacteraceae bacterium]|nr:Ig-like domain-containing protein [Ilumatobacteraceae bacterium]
MKTTRDFIAPRRKISLNQLFAVAVLSSLVWSKGALALCQPQPDCEATNTPPSVTLTAPTNGTTTTAPGTFVLTATATDDGAIDSVEFFSNNVSIGVDSSAPYSLSYGGLAVGSYAIKAKATDDLGVSRTSTVATVTVTAPANAPPTVNLTGPANGATATAPGSFTLTATAADSNGTIASVKFRNGATVLTTDTSYPYSYTYSELAAGSYAISAVATDNAGATATSATANVTVNAVANVAPTVTLTSPANGATSLPPASFSLTATAADSDGCVAIVKFISNGALLATDSTSPYAYTYA